MRMGGLMAVLLAPVVTLHYMKSLTPASNSFHFHEFKGLCALQRFETDSSKCMDMACS